jgi:predicted nucleotidyltransferase
MSKSPLGEKLRHLRLEQKLPLRKVAALLDIDVAILSKMERGERKLTKDIVLKLAGIYRHPTDELVVMFLSEKILYEIGEEEFAPQAMQMAEEMIVYNRTTYASKDEIIEKMRQVLEDDPKVKAAWLFGSFVRGDMHSKSDVDVMIRFDRSMRITMFDYAEVVDKLEKITKRKVDLVEEGQLSPFALKTAKKDMLKIYG